MAYTKACINWIKEYFKDNPDGKAIIGISGGKDSTILHYLIDLALPNNKIPRVFLNTGIEYHDIYIYIYTRVS